MYVEKISRVGLNTRVKRAQSLFRITLSIRLEKPLGKKDKNMLTGLCTKHLDWSCGALGSRCLNSYKCVGKIPLCALQICPVVPVRVPLSALAPPPIFECLQCQQLSLSCYLLSLNHAPASIIVNLSLFPLSIANF